MTEREKVISDVIWAFSEWENNMCCPGEDWSDVHQSRDIVIALLKAQEPIEPYTKRDGRTTFFLCGGCNKSLCIVKDSYKPKHCPECGRKVKWDG